MNSQFIYGLVVLACMAMCVRSELADLTSAIVAKYGETPCLNKVVGQRLVHPTDPHKFLRCMSLEQLWVETCPDGLFYNPSMELCDWSTTPRETTRSNEVVKNRPVLIKTKSKFLSRAKETTTIDSTMPIEPTVADVSAISSAVAPQTNVVVASASVVDTTTTTTTPTTASIVNDVTPASEASDFVVQSSSKRIFLKTFTTTTTPTTA